MRKLFLTVSFLLAVLCPLCAEVGVLSVTSEDVHTKKEDFRHTFEYYTVAPDGKADKCQATRIAKKWFVTAAHCVESLCKDGCTLRMDLLEQPYSIFSSIQHTPQKPVVFVHPKFRLGEPALHDFALLKLDLNKTNNRYYKRAQTPQEKNQFVSRAEFERFLDKNLAARRELNSVFFPSFPPLLMMHGQTARIDRTLSVISIFGGKREIFQSPYPADYVQEVGFAYIQNFGVRQGMSGSGIMTNTGELAGVVSGTLGIGLAGKPFSYYIIFAVFNPEILEFMEKTMGSDYYKLDRKDAVPDFVKPSPVSHQDFINGVHAVTEAE